MIHDDRPADPQRYATQFTIHTGMAPDAMFDPAVLAALLGDSEESFGLSNLAPSQAHRATRLVTVQLTPRLAVTRQVTVIRSSSPQQVTTNHKES